MTMPILPAIRYNNNDKNKPQSKPLMKLPVSYAALARSKEAQTKRQDQRNQGTQEDEVKFSKPIKLTQSRSSSYTAPLPKPSNSLNPSNSSNSSNTDLFDDSSMMMVMMMVMMMAMMQMFLSNQTQSQALQSQSQSLQAAGVGSQYAATTYQGRTDPRDITANPGLQWIDVVHNYPNRPWVSVLIENTGPYPCQIGINNPGDMFEVVPHISKNVVRTNSIDKISVVFYMTKPGETANLHLTGEY